ncbi:Peptidyl-prolyl isomerase cwc27 [Eufriesea mexicana]|uniref:Spliceosome-associated protein CWC27 homolog n=1 Tax=Eufriesea mexicana TaxID=516756 RepID=A0A310S9F6_9HYME|nr:Peptidyl-prolyl isomerase cwc27 [Eufriesea mexicana]
MNRFDAGGKLCKCPRGGSQTGSGRGTGLEGLGKRAREGAGERGRTCAFERSFSKEEYQRGVNASSFVLSRVEREEQKGFAGRGKQKGEDQRREGITCTNDGGRGSGGVGWKEDEGRKSRERDREDAFRHRTDVPDLESAINEMSNPESNVKEGLRRKRTIMRVTVYMQGDGRDAIGGWSQGDLSVTMDRRCSTGVIDDNVCNCCVTCIDRFSRGCKVVMKTTVGDIESELWAKETPRASRNFIQLCMDGYWDDTIFHGIIKGFITQGGDPTALSLVSIPKNYSLENDTNYQVSPRGGGYASRPDMRPSGAACWCYLYQRYPNLTWSELS